MHVNKNNVDGTGSPSNKIAWISFSVFITQWHLFNLLSMINELKQFLLKHNFEREFKFLRLSILTLSN